MTPSDMPCWQLAEEEYWATRVGQRDRAVLYANEINRRKAAGTWVQPRGTPQ